MWSDNPISFYSAEVESLNPAWRFAGSDEV